MTSWFCISCHINREKRCISLIILFFLVRTDLRLFLGEVLSLVAFQVKWCFSLPLLFHGTRNISLVLNAIFWVFHVLLTVVLSSPIYIFVLIVSSFWMFLVCIFSIIYIICGCYFNILSLGSSLSIYWNLFWIFKHF